ncbi:hypothetical protein CsSME_00029072 [Camellia sinensis var. sinensis]
MKTSRFIFSEISQKFPIMPFTARALEEKRARLGLVECVNHDLLQPYHVLHKKPTVVFSFGHGSRFWVVALSLGGLVQELHSGTFSTCGSLRGGGSEEYGAGSTKRGLLSVLLVRIIRGSCLGEENRGRSSIGGGSSSNRGETSSAGRGGSQQSQVCPVRRGVFKSLGAQELFGSGVGHSRLAWILAIYPSGNFILFECSIALIFLSCKYRMSLARVGWDLWKPRKQYTSMLNMPCKIGPKRGTRPTTLKNREPGFEMGRMAYSHKM